MKMNYHSLHITFQTALIVAVSGGPDSVALLDMLHREGFEQVVVAHLDHQVRAESHQDAQLVKKLAERFGYAFELRETPVKTLAELEKDNLEAVGRRERYRFFRELKDRYQACFIVTAHHADDQLETVLMNMIRGCGLEGLAGMRELDGDIWRPLLHFSKDELLRYCHEQKLSFIQESTNMDLRYRRNFIREKIVPLMKDMNPNLLGTMMNNVKIWRQAFDYFRKRAEQFLQQQEHPPLRCDLKRFLALDELDQQCVLRELFEQVHGHKQNLVQEHLEQILKVLRTNVSGKRKEFGSNKVIVRGKEWFEVREE